MMATQFEAEILFLDPADVPDAAQVLAALGWNLQVNHEAIDACGPTVFCWVTGPSELSENDLGTQLREILDPLGGDLIEWGYAHGVAGYCPHNH
jgi:hypothetical protein